MRRNRPAEPPVPATLATAHAAWQAHPTSRRRFLKGAGALLGGLMLPWLPAGPAEAQTGDGDPVWRTLAAVQKVLFPDDGNGPGADAIQATAYLQQAMALPRFPAAERDFLLQGPVWLDDLAREDHGRPFAALDAGQQDALLRRVARTTAGENWIALVLLYLFEALLTAPVYGGNPDGIGWRWLEHDPGFPLPTGANTYDRILKK